MRSTRRKWPTNLETQSLQSCPGAVESARAQGLKEPAPQARVGPHGSSMPTPTMSCHSSGGGDDEGDGNVAYPFRKISSIASTYC